MVISTDSARALFKTIIDCFEDAVFYLNRQALVEELNDAAQTMFAIDRDLVVGHSLSQILQTYGLLDIETDPSSNWSRRFEKDGKIFLANGRVLDVDAGMTGSIVIVHDISDSQKMTEYIYKLKETNRELEAVFRFSHDGLFVCDGNGIGVKYNESYSRITGIDGDEIMGLHMNDLLQLGYISESASLMVLQTKKQATTMPRLKSGKKALITANPVFDANGNVDKVISNVRDITELIQLKSQLEEVKELSERYYSELLHLRRQNVQVEGMIAESPVMKKMVATALKVAVTGATVLITGESGVGKEVLARTIHNHSESKAGPFVKVNCGAIPDTLLESELFGYEKGAFTNASKTGKMGIFEIAVRGTLFLDEIGEIPLALQAKLLGVLQDKKFTRVGGTKEIKLSARIIAATNRDLAEMVTRGEFRKDLFYRLNVVGLKIPPLAERKEDLFPMAHHFLRELNERYKFHNTISPRVINAFLNYDWPGNVREMENLMEQLVVLAPNEQITVEMLPVALQDPMAMVSRELPQEKCLEDILASVERRVFQSLLRQGYSSYKIAQELGINQSTAIRKIKKLGLNT